MKNRNILWGTFFIMAAILVVVGELGFLKNIRIWSLLLTVLLIPGLVKSILKLNFFGIFFPSAILLYLYRVPLGITWLSGWTALASALFLSIGFSILLKPRKRSHNTYYSIPDGAKRKSDPHETVDHVEENEINCTVKLSSGVKYLHSTSLQKGSLHCTMGSLMVFFDNASLHPDGAEINLNCELGSIELYIPKTWRVIINIDTFLGGIEEKFPPVNTEGPALVLTGEVHLGSIEITYI